MKKSIKLLTINAIIGAFYVALVFTFSFTSFQAIQFRIAEVLLILIIFNPKFAPGIILGTFLANLNSPFGPIDAVVGSIATTVTIIFMIFLRKIPILAIIMPAIFNGLIVGFLIYKLSLGSSDEISFFLAFSFVFIGEAAVMILLGIPLFYYIKKNETLKSIISSNFNN